MEKLEVKSRALKSFYLDIDIKFIRSIDAFILMLTNLGNSSFTVCQDRLPGKGSITIDPKSFLMYCNVGVAAEKQNTAVYNAIVWSHKNTTRKLAEKNELKYSLGILGPDLWTVSGKAVDFPLLHHKAFYPCGYNEFEFCKEKSHEEDRNVLAEHEWDHSWNKGPQPWYVDTYRTEIQKVCLYHQTMN